MYRKEEFIETETGNKISRESIICGSQNIVLGGKSIIQKNSILRGDLRRAGGGQVVVISMGRFCTLEESCLLRPPYKTYKGVFSYYPMKVGDYVRVGSRSIVEAASLGTGVCIGKDCIVGRFSIIKEYAILRDGTVLPPNTVVPPFSIYEGNPGVCVGELPESAVEVLEEEATQGYERFQLA